MAVFSGVRIEDAMSKIRRIFEAVDAPFDPDLDRAFIQLQAINAARNAIVHYGVDYDPDDDTGRSHKPKFSMPGRATELPVSVATIKAMSLDLQAIGSLFAVIRAPGETPPWDEDFDNSFRAAARLPWKYKPLAPKQEVRRPSTQSRKPKGPPQSLRE